MKGLNDLKVLLADDKLHLAIGKIVRLYLANDRSYLKCMVSIFPEERNVMTTMAWDSVGPSSGDFDFPSVGDMVIVANIEGDDDQAYIMKRLTSREDKIPSQAITGDKAHIAKTGKKYWNVSDTAIYLARGSTIPTENLVLGQIFKTMMSELIGLMNDLSTKISTHTHVGNMGYATGAPIEASDFVALAEDFDEIKQDPIDNSSILSDIAFTEK